MTQLRIDVPDRLSALELSRRLARHRTYLVQLGRDAWYVALKPQGNRDALLAEVLDVLEAWIADGGPGCVLRDGERSYPLRASAGSGG